MENLKKVWSGNLPDIVMAKDDAAFEAAYEKLNSEMEKAGMADMEKILTERYWQYADQLHEDYNKKWDEAAKR